MKHSFLCTTVCVAAILAAFNITSATAQDPAPHVSSNGQEPGVGRGGEGRRNGRMVRGSVTSTGANTVMIKTDAGEVWTVQTTDNTRLMKAEQPIKLTEVKAGDEVMAFGVPDVPAHQLHAMMVGVIDAATAAKARADMGKTYILGHITAIDETKLTVMRPDHVSQTIAVDESTSFHRGGRMNLEGMGFGGGMGGGGGRRNNTAGPRADENGESITLADIKVGDNIAGTGAIKAGVFTPTDLRVQEHHARGEAQGVAGGENAGAPQ